jgi:hypothetical protein
MVLLPSVPVVVYQPVQYASVFAIWKSRFTRTGGVTVGRANGVEDASAAASRSTARDIKDAIVLYAIRER